MFQLRPERRGCRWRCNVLRATAVVLGLVVSLALSSRVAAQAPVGGRWEGAIQAPGQELQVIVDLKGDGKNWEGAITIPVQGLKGLPLSNVSVDGESVSFVIQRVPGEPTFKGKLSKDGKTIAGDYSQGGGSTTFSLTRTGDAQFEAIPKSTAIDASLAGTWEGSLEVQGNILRLVANIARGADGTGTGTLISVDQGKAEIPIAAVIQNGAKVRLVVPVIIGAFEGELKGDQLSGTWTQGPGSWPLVLTRKK
jgi:hypothetical protein